MTVRSDALFSEKSVENVFSPAALFAFIRNFSLPSSVVSWHLENCAGINVLKRPEVSKIINFSSGLTSRIMRGLIDRKRVIWLWERTDLRPGYGCCADLLAICWQHQLAWVVASTWACKSRMKVSLALLVFSKIFKHFKYFFNQDIRWQNSELNVDMANINTQSVEYHMLT